MNRFIVRVRITLNIYKYTKVMRDKQIKKLKEMLKKEWQPLTGCHSGN